MTMKTVGEYFNCLKGKAGRERIYNHGERRGLGGKCLGYLSD
jgi:hypothetical protein